MAQPTFTLTAGDGLASRIGVTREALAGARLTLKCNIKRGDGVVIDEGIEFIEDVTLLLDEDGKINGDTGVDLLADDVSLGLENPLQWQVNIRGAKTQGFSRSVSSWWIDAGADGSTVSLDEQPKAVGQTAYGSRGARGYPLDDVQRVGDTLEFGVQGATVGTVDVSDLVFNGTIDEVTDAEAVGKAVVRSTSQAAARTAIAAAPQRIMRPNGPRLGVMGDSLHSYGWSSTSSPAITTRGPVIGRRVEWLSRLRVRMTNPQQDPGDTMSDVLNTQLPALLVADPLPNACIVAIGRNDVGLSFNLTTYLGQYETIANALFAAGVCPIFLTPMPTGAAGAPTATADPNLRKLSAGLRKLGAKLGVPVFDQYTALADETGGLKAAFNNGDNVHLTASGYAAVADSLINQGILDLFPSAIPTTVKDTADPNDLLVGAGLFKTGSPTGFSVVGTGTSVSFIDSVAADGIAGRWARITKVDASTATGAYRWTGTTGVTPASTYRISGNLRMGGTWNVEAGTYIQVVAEWRTGSSTTQSDLIVNRWDRTAPITFSEDYTAPAGVDGLRFVTYLAGTSVGDQTVDISEWSVRNLTAIGI